MSPETDPKNILFRPRNMINKRLLFTALSLSVVIVTGCISHEETVYRDAERKAVEFENDSAARIFYEALSKTSANGGRTEVKTEVSLPVVFDHKKKVVSGPNVAFNEAVILCDTNKDGRITEAEARIFAELKKK